MSEGSTTSAATAADLVIAELTASQALLIAEVRDLAADLDAYRLLAQVAVAEVARLSRLAPSENRT